MIRLVNIFCSFEGVKALDGLSLKVGSGALFGLLGPGGSGKSTLTKVMSGLLRPSAGVVLLAGLDLLNADRKAVQRLQSRIGVQFQNDALFEHMTVLANIEYPLKRLAGRSTSENTGRALERLAMVGLAGLERRYPRELSGGQRRRVALARACVTEPDLLICDDPTAGLDPVTSRRILDMILGIHYQARNTVVVASSDVLGLLSVAERVALLWDGRVIAEGAPAALWQDEREEVRRFIDDARLPTKGPSWI